MINKKIAISAGIGAVLGAALCFIALAHLGEERAKEARQRRADVALTLLHKEQARLGVQCIAADTVLFRYIRAVGPVVKAMGNGTPIVLSDPIIEQGERTADVLQTCRLQRRFLESVDNKSLDGLAIADDAVMEDFYSIRFLLTKVAASGCNSKCVADARQNVEASIRRLEQRLH